MTDIRMQCPCCGNPSDDLTAVIETLRPLAQRIMATIRQNPGVTTDAIVKAVYRRRSKPKDPANSVRVAISGARPALEAAGWSVRGAKGQGYRLERVGGWQ